MIQIIKRSIYIMLLSALSGSAFAQAPTTKADTLYLNSKWKEARVAYEAMQKTSPSTFGAVPQFRLGVCYQKLGDYREAFKHFEAARALKPTPALKPFLAARIAQNYALSGDKENSIVWLDSATRSGYAALNEVDTLKAFNAIRKDKRYEALRKRVYENAYPCATNPKQRQFDFWIGEWDVYVTGTTTPKVGHSLIQNVAGECLILENWTALGPVPNTGKSMNFFDVQTGTWEQVWMGSGGGLGRFINGKYEDGAMRFTFTQPAANGAVSQGKFTFFNMGPDKVRQLNETSNDQGKTWQTVYDFTYVRKKS